MSEPLDLFFLGSGNAFAQGGRYWSSFLLNGRYLFDASPAALPHIRRAGVEPGDIESVFISHLHADHYFGIPFLLLSYHYEQQREDDLIIAGPPGLQPFLTKVAAAAFPTVVQDGHIEHARFIDMKDGYEGSVDGLTYRAREVVHVPELTCFGYRVEVGGRTLAYSGDTTMCDALFDLADGADVFVVECSCWGDDCGPHLTPDNIRELRRRLGPKPTFVLTHMDAGDEDIGVENTVLAGDLKRFTF